MMTVPLVVAIVAIIVLNSLDTERVFDVLIDQAASKSKGIKHRILFFLQQINVVLVCYHFQL